MAGTVRKRGRSWQAILNFRDPLNAGKMVQFTATRPTKREAESALAELIVRRDHEQLLRGNQTFALAAEKWRQAKEQTAAPSSLLRYDMGLNTHLLPRFGDVQLRKLRTVASTPSSPTCVVEAWRPTRSCGSTTCSTPSCVTRSAV